MSDDSQQQTNSVEQQAAAPDAPAGAPMHRPPLLDQEFLAKIERLSLVSRRAVSGSVRGERRSKRRGFSNEFADYRDYVPGDDLRYLDWNIYGRLDRLFVKLFHEEEDLSVSILVDTSASMATGQPEKLTYALRVAAALAYIALVAEDRVGIYPFDTQLAPSFRPVRGKRNARRLFKYLQDLPIGGETCLEDSLKTYASAFSSPGMVILISDLLDPAGFTEAFRHLGGGRAESFLIHVLSPEEVNPGLVGDLRLVDCEDESVTEISMNGRLLEAYQKSIVSFREGIRLQAVSKGINPLFATTDVPFDQLVLGYLRKRGVLR